MNGLQGLNKDAYNVCTWCDPENKTTDELLKMEDLAEMIALKNGITDYMKRKVYHSICGDCTSTVLCGNQYKV